jgi:hypothetical protein
VDGTDAEEVQRLKGGGREDMSVKKSRLDRYKEIIDQYHLTPEDISNT